MPLRLTCPQGGRKLAYVLVLAGLGVGGWLSPYFCHVPQGDRPVVWVLFLILWLLGLSITNRAVLGGVFSIGVISCIEMAGRTKIALLGVPLRADDTCWRPRV